eukprot:8447083-Lingulodinium_polyedra.AAC.1
MAKDPRPHFKNRQIFCGAAELSIRNVGKAVLVADIRGIQIFTLDDARTILNVCGNFIDWGK